MPDPVTIAFIPESAGNPYWNSLVDGLRTGCKTLGCELTTTDGPATVEPTSQIPLITAQMRRGVDVIAIAPNSTTALNETFDQARRAGTLVLTVNGDLTGNYSHRDAAILPADFSKVGASQIELLGRQIQYAGEIAILSDARDAPDQLAWIADMRQVMSENPKYARMKLVVAAYAADAQKASLQAHKIIGSFPNLKGIVSPTTVGLAAAAQAIETAGKAQQIKLTGLGLPRQMRRFVHNGTVSSFQLWNPYNLGLLTAYFAEGVRRGKIRNVPGKTFSTPESAKVTVQEHNIIYAQGDLTTFDRSNVDRFNF